MKISNFISLLMHGIEYSVFRHCMGNAPWLQICENFWFKLRCNFIKYDMGTLWSENNIKHEIV